MTKNGKSIGPYIWSDCSTVVEQQPPNQEFKGLWLDFYNDDDFYFNSDKVLLRKNVELGLVGTTSVFQEVVFNQKLEIKLGN